MKRVCHEAYTLLFKQFIRKHGEYTEHSEHECGTTYKTIGCKDGAVWYECTRDGESTEFWSTDHSESRKLEEAGAWVMLGTRYKLSEKYSGSYDIAKFWISETGNFMKVWLRSNWNSSCYKTEYIYLGNVCEPFNVIDEYVAH